VARARIQGFEAGGAVDLPARFQLSANYTHLETENRATGAELTEKPRDTLNARLEWTPREDIFAQIRAEYVGRQRVSTGVLPTYSLWFFEARKRLTDQVALRIGIENITDQRLAEKSSAYTYAEPGRLYHLGFNLSF
jgi:outer membrane receptor for ferrienterochelin and colicins